MDNGKDKRYFFDDFEVDGTRRVLLKKGRPVALKPKTFDLLVAFVERRGRILSKSDLIAAVWFDQFIEDANLSVHVAALRKALGETKDENRFITTVPGTGYSFVAELTPSHSDEIVFETQKFERITIEDEIEYAEVDPGRSSLPAKRSGLYLKNWQMVVIGGLLVAALGFGGYAWQHRRDQNDPAQNYAIKRLTSTGNAGLAALSPDGRFYVYSLLLDRGSSLWLGNVDGGDAIQLRPPAETNYASLSFAPDGRGLYFVCSDKDHPTGELLRMPLFGGVPEKLWDGINSVIAFSPDGHRFAYVRNDEKTDRSSLIVADLDSRTERELAVRPFALHFFTSGRTSSPSWSPDGALIAVGAIVDGGATSEVFSVSAADGTLKQLTNFGWSVVRTLSWPTNGGSIIVEAAEQDPNGVTWQLYQMSYPDGTVSKLISDLNSYGSTLSLSADGKSLLGVQSQTISNIWIVPGDNLAAAKQFTTGSIGEMNGWWGFEWTPEGRIVYTKFVDKTRSIWSMNEDGTNQKQLIPSGGENFYPSVTADGRYMVFQSTRSGKPEVWRANTDGSDMLQLTDVEIASQPRVSPDGKWVIYVSNLEHSGTLYRIPIDGGSPVQLTDVKGQWVGISPDSQYVACACEIDHRLKLAIIPIVGGDPVKIFDLPAGANPRLGLQWTIDGRSVTSRDWTNGIWKQSIKDGSAERLTGLPNEKIFAFGWSRDGKQFAFTRGTELRDLVLFGNFR